MFLELRVFDWIHNSCLLKEFNPLSPVPWIEQVAFTTELISELAQPVQPSHAELHFILSRCYAEGYGHATDYGAAIKHLFLAASLDNVEATCLIQIGSPFFREFAAEERPKLAHNDISKSMQSVHAMALKTSSSTTRLSGGSPAAYARAWNQVNREFARSRQFFWQDGTSAKDRAYEWKPHSIQKFLDDVEQSGGQVCDTSITYASLVASFNSGNFYEVCAFFDFSGLFQALDRTSNEAYVNSSWGDHNEVWSRLLNSAAKGGNFVLLERLVPYGTRGAAKEWISPTGESPLHHLSFMEESLDKIDTLVKRLLDVGMDINTAVTTRTWIPPFSIELSGTPLQMAVRANCPRAVQVLLENGASSSEGFGDAGQPLDMAASLHLHEIVSIFMEKARVSARHADQALKSIGVPTRKGWYERSFAAVPNSRLQPGDTLFQDVYFTVAALMGHAKLLETSPTDTRRDGERIVIVPDSFWIASEAKQARLDGSPLIEAISRGQRNLDVLKILMELGVNPHSDESRYRLLEAIMKIWEDGRDNPLPRRLLGTVLAGHAVHTKTAALEKWAAGWPRFFEEFRCKIKLGKDMPVLHQWISRGALAAVETLAEAMPQTMPLLVSMEDSTGSSALRTAIDHGSKGMYDCLAPYKSTTIAQDISMACSSRPSSALLPMLLEIQMEEKEMVYFENIAAVIKEGERKRRQTIKVARPEVTRDAMLSAAMALEEFAQWAFENHQWRRLEGQEVPPPLSARERFRRQLTVTCLLTTVRLRMQAASTRKAEGLPNAWSGGIPHLLRDLYGYGNAVHFTGLHAPRTRFLQRLHKALDQFDQTTISWTYSRQRSRKGQLGLLEWFEGDHYRTIYKTSSYANALG
jgi:ankyrin repeat protein